MQKLRESADADRVKQSGEATQSKNEQNQFQIECAECGGHYFVDRQKYARLSRAVAEGLDNPFVCEDCERDYDELAFGR